MQNEQFTFFYGGPGSNWYPDSFVIEGVTYNCGEQYMMAQKAILFNDADALEIIMGTDQPKIQKATGRLVKGFDPVKWGENAKLIVYRASLARFSQNAKSREWLFASKGTTLVEASPWDKIWGIGLEAKDPKALSRDTWQGTNWLGEINTAVREDLFRIV